MKIDFWISILAAIPLAIIANLVTPKLRDWLDRRAEKSAHRKRTRTKAELQDALLQTRCDLDQASSFSEYPSHFHDYLLTAILKATLYGAVAGIYAAGLSLPLTLPLFGEHYFDFARGIRNGLVISTQLVGMLGSLMVFSVAWQALKVAKRVQSFNEYKLGAEKRITSLENELKQMP